MSKIKKGDIFIGDVRLGQENRWILIVIRPTKVHGEYWHCMTIDTQLKWANTVEVMVLPSASYRKLSQNP